METKNSKRVLLTDEELMGVVGGLVQIINPSSSVGYGSCIEIKTKKECKARSECTWFVLKQKCGVEI